ncbi:MAG: thermonuclease family protein [Methanobrevibacter sp.]
MTGVMCGVAYSQMNSNHNIDDNNSKMNSNSGPIIVEENPNNNSSPDSNQTQINNSANLTGNQNQTNNSPDNIKKSLSRNGENQKNMNIANTKKQSTNNNNQNEEKNTDIHNNQKINNNTQNQENINISVNNESNLTENNSSNYEITGYCTKVIDGSTIEIETDGGIREKVKFVGLKTSEEGEEGYDESKNLITERCLNKTVYLDVDDAKNKDTDNYTLAIVYDENGENLNQILLKNGFAEVMYIPPSEFEKGLGVV